MARPRIRPACTNTSAAKANVTVSDTSTASVNNAVNDVSSTPKVMTRPRRNSTYASTSAASTKVAISDTSTANDNNAINDVPSTPKVMARPRGRSACASTSAASTQVAISDTSTASDNDAINDVSSTPKVTAQPRGRSASASTSTSSAHVAISDTSDASDSDNSQESAGVQQRRRKLYSNNRNLKRETAKINMARGLQYKKGNGEIVPGKNFKKVTQCCLKKCCEQFSENLQSQEFKTFYNFSDKSLADAYVAKSMTNLVRKSSLVDPKKPRVNIWKYELVVFGKRFTVCKNFLIALYQISKKRIETVQAKLKKGGDCRDKRGNHSNRPHKFSYNVRVLMKEHLALIPSRKSHYSTRTNLNYFENPELNVKKLFELFQNYYERQTNTPLKMGYHSYFKIFRTEFSYGFRRPKTDVCNFCTECTTKLKQNPNDPCRVDFDLHVKKKEARQKLKKEFILKAKSDPSYLVLEFDYSQNYAIPRLNVNDQFYKRMLWLYAFNVHVHNDDASYFYTYTENQGAKNSNSVASFLHDCLKQNLKKFSNVKTIVLLSDATSGQNRNITITKFCSWFSRVHNLSIVQLFPVRGHSFSQCDRNFGLIRASIKKREIIGTAKPYLEAMVLARKKSPFIVEFNAELLKDWEASLNSFFPRSPKAVSVRPAASKSREKFKIMQYCIIRYEPDGKIKCAKGYDDKFIDFMLSCSESHQNLQDMHVHRSPSVPVSPAKIADVRSLLKFLQIKDRKWLRNLLNNL